ncbi:component of SufBCD complex [bacterium]|nr:component of SufBCD complex [bacterium]
MTWYQMLVEMIDLRSFSNLWYWIALAVIWSSASHWVLGVPYDMVARAHRQGGAAQEDLETLVRINTSRMLYFSRERGPWLVGFVCFLATVLVLMGFVYRVEFAQAVLFLFVPLCGLGYLSLRSALKVEAGEGQGEALHRRLFYHRLSVQALGMVSIFVTSMYGMYVNAHLFVSH